MASEQVIAQTSQLIQDAYVSTLRADREGIKQYLSILREMQQMPPFVFRYTDEYGAVRLLQVPVITLAPLSLLHIEEAEFTYRGQIAIEDRRSVETTIPSMAITKVPAYLKQYRTWDSKKNALVNKGEPERIYLTTVYDVAKKERREVDNIKVYQSRKNATELTFVIEDNYYYADERKSAKDMQESIPAEYYLMGFGKPYTRLCRHAMSRNQEQRSKMHTQSSLLLVLYANGKIEYAGRKLVLDPNGTKTIAISLPYHGRKRNYYKHHIASGLYLSYRCRESLEEARTNLIFEKNTSGKVQETQLSIKVRLSQGQMPMGLMDVLRVMQEQSRVQID